MPGHDGPFLTCFCHLSSSNTLFFLLGHFSYSLLAIAEETLAEFLSKATGTAVDWVQMVGMKVMYLLLSYSVLELICYVLFVQCNLFLVIHYSLVRILLESLLFPTIVVG